MKNIKPHYLTLHYAHPVQTVQPLLFSEVFYMEEIWKPIKDYPNYEVSNLGNIKNLKFTKERFLKVQTNKNGYSHVVLSNNGIHTTWRVHKLVINAFSKNTNKDLEVNHKDGVKNNNVLTNLEWVTRSENMKHSFDVLGRIGNETGKYLGSHNTAKKIIQYSKDGSLIRCWDSIKEAALVLRISPTNISHCLSKVQHSSGGYKWEYLK